MFTVDEISKKYGLKDKSKLQKQIDLYNLWKFGDKIRNIKYAKSIIKAKTAFGKSVIGLLALYENQSKSRKGTVIVPTKALKKDWESYKTWWGLDYDVIVINTAVKKIPDIDSSLIVFDEIHLFGRGTKWKQIFNLKAPYQLGLTATLPEDDEQYFYLLTKLPVIADVTWDEVIDNNYICDFQIYKYPIHATPAEAYKMDRWRTDFWKYINIVGDFKKAQLILKDKHYREQLAYQKDLDPGSLFGSAKTVMSIVANRSEFFYNHPLKLQRCIDIINYFETNNIITFNQRNAFVDEISELLGDFGQSYHSGKSDTHNDWVLRSFKHHNGKTRVINTSMALNQGVNIPKIDIAIFNSWTSSQTSMNQRIGRAVRIAKNKDIAKIFINPLCRIDGKKTQDERWLEKAMVDVPINKVKIINELTDEI
jgi:superfamily II DNA or RNA helicase